MDQKTVRAKIDEKVLNDRVILYPGADELGMVLVSRAINALENNTPRVYLKYASTLAPQLIPNYEDRSLNETVKYHVMAAGCIAVPSLADADVVMASPLRQTRWKKPQISRRTTSTMMWSAIWQSFCTL